MEVDQELLRERVKRGAALLNNKHPDWAAKIDVNDLNMTFCLRCVLGQLLGEYNAGRRCLGLSSAESFACGFIGEGKGLGEDTAALKEPWLEEIKARRK